MHKNLICLFLLSFLLLITGCPGPKKNPQEILQKGDSLFQQKKFKESVECYYEYTKLEPADYKGFLALGKNLLELKRDDEALYCFDKAVELKPEEPEPYQQRVNILESKGLNEKAKQDLDKIIELSPKDPIPVLRKGIIEYKDLDYESAYKTLNRVITFDISAGEEQKDAVIFAYAKLLEIIGHEGKTDPQALEIIKKATELMPDNSRCFACMGVYNFKKQNWDKALENFETALKIDPILEGYSYRALSLVWLKKDEHEKAVQYMEKFVQYYEQQIKQEESDIVLSAQIYAGMGDPFFLNIEKIRKELETLRE